MKHLTQNLCIVLHAHLPYVAHKTPGRLEERWLYEVLTETYIPLLMELSALKAPRVPYLSLSLTGPLLAMLEQKQIQDRYVAHLKRLVELSAREMERTEKDPEMHKLARFYHTHFTRILNQFLDWDCSIIPVFKAMQDSGKIEIMASSATHGFLPAVQYMESKRVQISLGVETYRRHFGRRPRGFWLPECAVDASLADLLAEEGLEWFMLDTHAAGSVSGGDQPVHPGEPARLINGMTAFFRNHNTSELVWNSQHGYPGDVAYREFYRDIGWDLGWNSAEEWDYIKPYLLDTGDRIDTGIKYYRITGKGAEKQLYDPDEARGRVSVHAHHFLEQCSREPIQDAQSSIVAMYDAELFGHWWFEGVLWLRSVIDAAEAHDVELTTPSHCLPTASTEQHISSMSTWGRGGYADVWINEKNHWMYRHLHTAEKMMLRATAKYGHVETAQELLHKASQQLLLAQTSDWAFIIDSNTVTTYAANRFVSHISSFYDLLRKLPGFHEVPAFPAPERDVLDEDLRITSNDERKLVPLFKQLPASSYLAQLAPGVCMLTLEYPPNVVGGLGKAVSEMSEKLASQGEVVHVVTIAASEDDPAFEILGGVHVHRALVPYTQSSLGFLDWIFQVNLAIIDKALELQRGGCPISVIHAHDWLVNVASQELASLWNLPLVVTIHATEWGRNGGSLTGDLQKKIHRQEVQLTQRADHVLVCSKSMKNEVCRLFHIDEQKTSVVPNGLLPRNVIPTQRKRSSNQVLFVGRLVYEKGLTTLLEAMRQVLKEVPGAVLVIAGRGPMKAELERQSADIRDHVKFHGFATPAERDKLLAEAAVAVVPSYYEPFGLSALEAMQAGCPVVVSDTGGLIELVDHLRDGLRAYPGDANSLAQQIIYALQNKSDANTMAHRARQKVETQFLWDSCVAKISEVYENLAVSTG